jgi:NADH:ubiquinone oxidoreductase subunit 6 (subunit J)
MVRVMIWVVAVAVLVLILVMFRNRTEPTLNVTPEAREAIEKAKRR